MEVLSFELVFFRWARLAAAAPVAGCQADLKSWSEFESGGGAVGSVAYHWPRVAPPLQSLKADW